MKKRINWKILIVSLLVVFAISFVGSLFTSGTVRSDWYLENRLSYTPPDYIFGPVWTLLYILIAISLYFSWTNAKKTEKKKVAWIFGINLVLNALWSILFFGFRKPGLAFIDLIAIWITIVMMIFIAGGIDRKAGWLLVPYLLWVSFAGFLNFGFL